MVQGADTRHGWSPGQLSANRTPADGDRDVVADRSADPPACGERNVRGCAPLTSCSPSGTPATSGGLPRHCTDAGAGGECGGLFALGGLLAARTPFAERRAGGFGLPHGAGHGSEHGHAAREREAHPERQPCCQQTGRRRAAGNSRIHRGVDPDTRPGAALPRCRLVGQQIRRGERRSHEESRTRHRDGQSPHARCEPRGGQRETEYDCQPRQSYSGPGLPADGTVQQPADRAARREGREYPGGHVVTVLVRRHEREDQQIHGAEGQPDPGRHHDGRQQRPRPPHPCPGVCRPFGFGSGSGSGGPYVPHGR